MEIKETLEFFIDTYTSEAHDYIEDLLEKNPKIAVINVQQDSPDSHFFHFQGSWKDYKIFMPTKVDLNLPENAKYHYSLYHYEE